MPKYPPPAKRVTHGQEPMPLAQKPEPLSEKPEKSSTRPPPTPAEVRELVVPLTPSLAVCAAPLMKTLALFFSPNLPFQLNSASTRGSSITVYWAARRPSKRPMLIEVGRPAGVE